MKTYKIYTLGCKVNQYDSGRLASELARAGFIMAKKNADLAVINSCAVTKTAMVKSARMIKSARKENPKAKIVLAGCWPKAYKIKNVDADFVITGDKVSEAIKKITNYELRITDKIQRSLLNQQERSRYFIKIQDGCEQFCSYCIIPYTRGKLKSRGEREVINEIKQAVKAGYGEIVLSGIHLGLYGKKSAAARNGKAGNLADLLKKIIKIKNLGRIRLSSIEITEVSDELIELMAKSDKICKHLHIPLQAGSDKILKLMNRPYETKYFESKIKKIRKLIPNIAIGADAIVGFSGETEKDFRATEKFIRQMKFSRLHVFPFSVHEKTPAAKFPGRVEEKIKARRAKILRRLGVKLAENYRKKFNGRGMEIVVERIKRNKIIGKTEYYFDVEADRKKIKNKNFKIGEIIKVK